MEQILNGLEVPWFPIIGNHDTWIYNSTFNEPFPTGDSLFAKTFAAQYARLTQTYGNDTYFQIGLVNNPEQNIESAFQNFELKYCNMVFYGLDWNSRMAAAPGYRGAWPGVQLHNFTGGTFDFLEKRLALLSQTKSRTFQIVSLQHHPYRAPLFVPSDIYGWAGWQKAAMRTLFETYFPVEQYFGVIAGHWHRWFNGTAFDEWPTFRQWETAACKEGGYITIATVSNGNQITDLERLQAPTSLKQYHEKSSYSYYDY